MTGRYAEFDAAPTSTHSRIVDLVPKGARVLEFGCATGYMSQVLRERLDCSVTGIEIDPEAARVAEAHCERVIADDGAVVASIPNVAHGSVRLALLAGQFQYRERGLLDAGHVRFFTRDSVQDLFEETGYTITNWARQRLELGESEIAVPPLISRDSIEELLAQDVESTTYQFIIRAVPSDEASNLAAAHRELREARQEREEKSRLSEEIGSLGANLAASHAELDATRQELDALRRAHEERGKRLVAERLEFANELSELQRHLEALHRSRSFRYTAVFRRFFGVFRGR